MVLKASIMLFLLSCFIPVNTKGGTAIAPVPAVGVPSSPPPPLPVYKAPPPPSKQPPKTLEDCHPLCLVRCEKHYYWKRCMRACKTCCTRCHCVPPGHFGNKEKCGKCYAEMKTHGGKLKCP